MKFKKFMRSGPCSGLEVWTPICRGWLFLFQNEKETGAIFREASYSIVILNAHVLRFWNDVQTRDWGAAQRWKGCAAPDVDPDKVRSQISCFGFLQKILWNMRTELATSLGKQTQSKRSSTEQKLSKHNWEKPWKKMLSKRESIMTPSSLSWHLEKSSYTSLFGLFDPKMHWIFMFFSVFICLPLFTQK